MDKTGEFKVNKSTCDFCKKPAVTVNEHGVAVCKEHRETKKLEKQAFLMDREPAHEDTNA